MRGEPQARILLVDDKPANLIALEAVLDPQEYFIVKTFSGAEAIKCVEEQDFATILLDVQMPGLDGYETAKRIKSLPRGKDVPIIFVTAIYKEDEDVRKGYEAGGVDYFAKPFIPSALKAKVHIYADLFCKSTQLSQLKKLLAAKQSRVRERVAASEGASDGLLRHEIRPRSKAR